MFVEAQVTIDAPKESVWAVITDFQNAAETISAINQVEILDEGADDLVGLKWRETRTMMGKTATEDMWITEAVANDFYKARAESHGFVYLSTLRVSEQGGQTTLTMDHKSEPQGFLAKVLGVPMGILFKGMMRKAFAKDLGDIKAAVERNA